MATAIPAVETRTGVARRVLAGAAGGLIGGAAFGAMMQAFGMLPMVAMLVGSESVAVGWAVHLSISVALGAGFGLIAVRGLDGWGSGIALGVAYGLLWWVLGALLIMPAQLGMPVLQLSTAAWQSLAGHIVFGLVLGAVSVAAVRTSEET
jgi:uncharacterized membrane protein YagU involved in acid resistance